MTLVTKFKPASALRSNIAESPVAPIKRLQALLMLKGETIVSYSMQIGMGYPRLRRLLKSEYWNEMEAQKVVDGLGLKVSDIWPQADQEQAA